MVVQANSAEVMMIEALGKVHMQVGMIAQVTDRNGVNGLALSILVAKIERVFHVDIGSHATNAKSDQYWDRNMNVHYNQKNVVEVQEPYLHVPEASFFALPQHTIVRLQVSLL